MADVVLFGTGQIAEVAFELLQTESDHRVVAFTLDDEYITKREFRGLPIVGFHALEDRFPPSSVRLFIPIGAKRMNRSRREHFDDGRRRGYDFISFISPNARVSPTAIIGENCFIQGDNVIQTGSSIGDNVVMWSGNHIGHHTTIEDDVFIASHAVVSGAVRIGRGSFLGVNATIGDNCIIGTECIIGAGATITKDTPDHSVWVPARATMLDKYSHQVPGFA